MKRTLFFATFFIVFAFIGCGKTPPSGLPPLVSCKVKVHDNGRPLPKIGVAFQRTEGHAGWSLNGLTGTDGIAVARTIAGSFDAPGLPTGSYRVTLNERIELPPEFNNDDDPTMAEKRQKYLAEHRTLPEILCDPARTPLELTVTGSAAELDIDVSRFK